MHFTQKQAYSTVRDKIWWTLHLLNVFYNPTCLKASGIKNFLFWNHMFCNGLIYLNRYTKWNNFCPKFLHLVFSDKIILVIFWNDAKRVVLNRLLDPYYNFVAENLEKYLTRFVQYKIALRTQGYSCKNLVRNIKVLKEICKNKAILTRICKSSVRIMHSPARSCKSSWKNLARISFLLN